MLTAREHLGRLLLDQPLGFAQAARPTVDDQQRLMDRVGRVLAGDRLADSGDASVMRSSLGARGKEVRMGDSLLTTDVGGSRRSDRAPRDGAPSGCRHQSHVEEATALVTADLCRGG
ncbi:hypothetical protein GCM10010335_45110 [Streptomyces galbus]|nr:hypothetical protein GCM10010335_45110 [Streptomyces galbus]